MKISGRKQRISPVQGLQGPSNGNKVDKTPPTNGLQGEGVDVSFSASMSEMERASEAAKDLPDVRTEKVASLKGAVEEGRYHVDSAKVAKKMVDEALLESARQRRR